MAAVISNAGSESSLIQSLHEVLLTLHHSPYPHVPNPPQCKRRAAVALILRIRPSYDHRPPAPVLPLGQSATVTQRLESFFSQDWVKHGDPEVLFIKRAARVGDRWTGHVALPGGKRDPEDEDDKATAIREAWEEIGLDLNAENAIPAGNLPERVVTTSWASVPLMVLCPYIFILSSGNSPTLNLQPTEVASTHWLSLRALLSPSLRTVEHVDVSDRYAKQGGLASRLAQRWMTGMMEFSAVRLVPTESLYCSSIPGFLPDDHRAQLSTLFQKWKAWTLKNQATSADVGRPLLLWGLTLGIMADLLDMLPPHNAVKLWKHPTFTSPDLRLIVSILTYRLRQRNAKQVRTARRPSDTASDDTTIASSVSGQVSSRHDPNAVGIGGLGVGRYYGSSSTNQHAVGIMLKGYYDRLRLAITVFVAWRLAVGSVASFWLWRWLRRR